MVKFGFVCVLGFCLSAPLAEAEDAYTLPPLPKHLELPDCELGPDCPIPFNHLSNQTDEPFFVRNEVFDERFSAWRKYADVIEEFHDVRDCLIASEAKKEAPNLLLIDWSKGDFVRTGQVCLFRIASSLRHPSLMQEWIRYHDFRLSDLKLGDETHVSYSAVVFTGIWNATQYRERKPNWIAALTGIDVTISIGFGVRYNRNLDVVDVFLQGRSIFQ
ncbi:hypothetical protein [Lentibacter sp. XHP0401]|uniref:hypothetical protein n=1 Tax=Lentibacter sp. XHP0401 TaxID=2984334 RepID=UPI0021E95809|nr:hypothetical protein [Lentibacter sp. XHP0401]MCV2893844.1 hypothetical protein [Lentibacter sp. XHP0401]